MTIDVLAMEYLRGLVTSSTDTSFTAAEQNPTGTKPAASTTRAVFDRGPGRNERNSLVLLPFGGDADNDQFSLKVVGWNRVGPKAQNGLDLWVSVLLAEIAVTLSSAIPGVAGRQVVATELFADTLSLTSGLAVLYQGTADIDLARAEVPVDGYEIVEVFFDLTTGGDRANFLYAFK